MDRDKRARKSGNTRTIFSGNGSRQTAPSLLIGGCCRPVPPTGCSGQVPVAASESLQNGACWGWRLRNLVMQILHLTRTNHSITREDEEMDQHKQLAVSGTFIFFCPPSRPCRPPFSPLATTCSW